ncbi:MAG: AraC family transcriptional regulator [Massilioclostridium sp.]|nr:AraC family transcriptional regulator [Massilioclostridium sp.]
MKLGQYIQEERERAVHILYDEAIRDGIMKQQKLRGFHTVPFKGIARSQDQDIAILYYGLPLGQPPKQYVWHNHDYFEIIYVHSGSCFNRFQGETIKLCKGDILLLNPTILHQIYALHEEDHIFNIMLSKSLFEGSMWQLLSGNKIINNFFVNYFYQMNKTKDYVHFRCSQNHLIEETITSLIAEYLGKKPAYYQVIQSYLIILFAYLSRIYSEQHFIEQQDLEKIGILPDIISFIAQNYQSVTLTEIQNVFNYSSGYTSRLIKHHTGKTFSEIVHDFKLNHAKELLVSTNLNITDIAEKIGFNDSHYLNKVFKKRFGITPTQYRRGMKKE